MGDCKDVCTNIYVCIYIYIWEYRRDERESGSCYSEMEAGIGRIGFQDRGVASGLYVLSLDPIP